MSVLKEILKKVPQDAMISNTNYEGANIVLYTKNKTFFLHGGDIIRKLVDEFKKRIDLRADSSLRKDSEEVEKFIRKTIPKEAEITQVLFESARGIVTIEAKKPGLAIGKDGENLKEIKDKTLWTPIVRRESVIPSKITTNIRNVLYSDSEARRKFLDKIGKRIYETKRSTTDEMWARMSFLGGARQVGRSCLLLQTPESKVLIDCGINVASDKHAFPYLNAPEFHINDLDAVIISHAHLDHSGFLPYLFKMGYKGPVYCTEPTRDVMALLALDYIQVSRGQSKDAIYSSSDIKESIKNTITLDYGEVTDITPDVRITLYNAGHILGSTMVHLHLGEGWHNILYTGDYKVKKTQLLNPAHAKFPRVETFITEATYGLTEDILPSREKCEKEVADIVKKTLNKKGKVLIPVLGVGRAQEVMVILEKLFREEKIKVPIYVDGMVWDVTAIHNAYPKFLNSDVREKIFYEDKDPFLSKVFKQVGSGKERAEVISGGPCVILATSGMLTG
ncbi:beta-CASP ribonuclease aCPSF1, partial [Candidatus Woesearchaeota archaeon]|nr:beta-CASP ribonuclease aCPSF1 [Candidatus Woesearchaeota archaeon]